MKAFIKHKIWSIEIILSAYTRAHARARTHTHTHTHTQTSILTIQNLIYTQIVTLLVSFLFGLVCLFVKPADYGPFLCDAVIVVTTGEYDTVRRGWVKRGVTLSSFSSVSASPAIISFCLGQNR